MKQEKSCKNCLKSFSLNINNDYLCQYKGVVSGDYVCKKHKFFDSVLINVKLLKCEDCCHFIHLENQNQRNFGVCSIFTERQYNGTLKRACSKIKIKKLDIANFTH